MYTIAADRSRGPQLWHTIVMTAYAVFFVWGLELVAEGVGVALGFESVGGCFQSFGQWHGIEAVEERVDGTVRGGAGGMGASMVTRGSM